MRSRPGHARTRLDDDAVAVEEQREPRVLGVGRGRANGMRIALGIITFFLVCAMRGRVRRISGIPGGPCGDGCSTLFCFSCTLAQMARHTMQYDKNPDWRCGTGGAEREAASTEGKEEGEGHDGPGLHVEGGGGE